MKQVSKEQFYAVIGQIDAIPSTGASVTKWHDRQGRLLGETEGYLITEDVGPKFYKLVDSIA